MSRQSREYVAKMIDENKQLSTLKDSNYLQHEQGYTLSPDFQKLQNKTYLAQTEAKCWEASLLNIKAGKPIQEITGFSPNGEPIFDKAHTATDADEIRITNNLYACNQAAQQLSEQLQSFPQQFKQRIGQDLQTINEVQKEKFAWVADPKLLDYSITVDGQGEQKLKDIKNNFKSVFPSYLANSVAVDVASNLMVSLMIQSAELKEARNGQQIEQIKRQEVQRGEPSSDAAVTEPSKLAAKGIPSVFSLEGLPT